MPNFIGIISTLGHLDIRLYYEHRQQISEFISEKIKDFNERKDFNSSSYENFILGMQRIYDPDFSLDKLSDSSLKNNTKAITEKRNPEFRSEVKFLII